MSRAFLWFFLVFAGLQVLLRIGTQNKAMPPMLLWCAVGAFCAARLFGRRRPRPPEEPGPPAA